MIDFGNGEKKTHFRHVLFVVQGDAFSDGDDSPCFGERSNVFVDG